MPYYGHRCGIVPARVRDAWWVCSTCAADFVPRCGICQAPAPVIDHQPGFTGYAYGRLCSACVARVQSGGPWRKRRALAIAARRDVLLERYPGLAVVRDVRSMIMLAGRIDDREVEVRLRVSARQYTGDRYIFHVEVGPAWTSVTIPDLGLPEPLRRNLSHDPPAITQTQVRWLRVAFAHLGKLDVLTALTTILERTAAPPVRA
ncbi:MAG: hypothetical protein R3B09_33145 [Nannocystaceae bacterium]